MVLFIIVVRGLQKHCSRLPNAGYRSLMLKMHSCLINDIQYYETYLTVDENSTKWLEPEKSEVDQPNVTTMNRQTSAKGSLWHLA